MEYANLASFERLTGKALFTPTGDTGAIDLGNIKMVKNELNPKTAEILLSQRGHQVLARRDVYAVTPVFTITGDQFATPELALLLMGDKNADLTQTSGTASTFTVTSVPGRSFAIGKYNLSNVTVKVSTTTAVINVDYTIDLFNGIISFPVTPGSVITSGASVTVTYDNAAGTLEDWTAFTKLNRQGSLVVYAEDEYGPPAKEIWTMTAQLSVKAAADFDPSKFREFALEASIFGNPDVQKRKN